MANTDRAGRPGLPWPLALPQLYPIVSLGTLQALQHTCERHSWVYSAASDGDEGVVPSVRGGFLRGVCGGQQVSRIKGLPYCTGWSRTEAQAGSCLSAAVFLARAIEGSDKRWPARTQLHRPRPAQRSTDNSPQLLVSVRSIDVCIGVCIGVWAYCVPSISLQRV